MKDGKQINAFGQSVDQKLAAVRQYLPEDLIIARTSDQPLQVKENIGLFMDALYEAIILVVLVSLVGFWEWRSAVLMAISIPITLAMTFGMMYLLGVDIQQVSVATLIIALGLAGGRSGRRRRFDQARAGRRPPEYYRRLAGADEAGHRDPVCHHHQYRGLSSLPSAHRKHRRISLFVAHRHDLRAGRVAPGFDELYSVPWLLSFETGEKKKNDRGTSQRGLLWLVLPGCAKLDRTSLEVFHRLSGVSGDSASFSSGV